MTKNFSNEQKIKILKKIFKKTNANYESRVKEEENRYADSKLDHLNAL